MLFSSLDREQIKQVAALMLARVAKDLEKRGVALEIQDTALDALADVGFDPEFGARPMRRAIQEKVENQLAELVLTGGLSRRDTVVLGQGGSLSVALGSVLPLMERKFTPGKFASHMYGVYTFAAVVSQPP